MLSVVPYVASAQGRGSRVRRVKKPRQSMARLSPNAVVYKGPVKVNNENQSNDVQTVQVNYYGSVASSAGGVIATVFDAYSSATSSADWSSLANLYQEYRIISYDIEMQPWNKYNTPTTTALSPIISITDRQDNTALSSLSVASAYNSSQIHSSCAKIKRTIKMNGVNEAQWIKTGSSPATTDRLYVKLYSSGNAASTTTHDYLARVLVQFRGRQ